LENVNGGGLNERIGLVCRGVVHLAPKYAAQSLYGCGHQMFD